MQTKHKLNTLKVIFFFFFFFTPFFSSCRQILHCKYLLASNIHSRIFACTVFSFIAFHFLHELTSFWTFKNIFSSNHPAVVELTEGLGKVGWKFTVHVKWLFWDTLPSWLLIKTPQCYV